MAFSNGWIGPRFVGNGLQFYMHPGSPNAYNGTGTSLKDISGNSSNVTLTNGPVYSSINGGILSFDGTNDFVVGSTTTQLNANSGSCLSMWVKTSSTATQVLGSYDSALTNGGFRFQISANVLKYTLGVVADYSTGLNISDGAWRNIVASTTGSSLIVYVNGSQQSSFTMGTMNMAYINYNSVYFRFGTYDINNTFYFTGSMGPVLIYDRPLTSDEVLQNYNAYKSNFGL